MKPQRLWFTTWTTSLTQLCATVLFALVATQAARAQSFTNFRIANGTSGENPAVLWVGVDQGFYRKHGLNVEKRPLRRDLFEPPQGDQLRLL